MKNLLFKVSLCLSFIFLQTCDNSFQDKFIVNGEIEGLEDTEILILKFDEGVDIDTVQSVSGKFSYTGSTNKPIKVQLLAQIDNGLQKLDEFILENSSIKVQGNVVNIDDITVSGSQSDKIFNTYLNEDQLLVTQWDSIKVIYDQAKRANDSINTKKFGDQLNQILFGDRVNLLKKYVLDYYDESTGPLIPNFCRLEHILTPDDFLEMYNMLSEESKASYYGQMIKLKAKSN
jgi:hypothetical protein